MPLSSSLFGNSSRPMPMPSNRMSPISGGNVYSSGTKMPNSLSSVGSTPRPMGSSSMGMSGGRIG